MTFGSMKTPMLLTRKHTGKLRGGDNPPLSIPTSWRNENICADELALGWTWDDEKGEFQMLKIRNEDRFLHMYCVGGTGSGKTKFIEFPIQQDIWNRRGFGVISPHADLITDIKGFLACYAERHGEEIFDQVILVDPCDPKFTVLFNPLELLPGVSPEKQAQEFTTVCKRQPQFKDFFGPRMENLWYLSLVALGEAGQPLSMLPRFLADQEFRRQVLEKVSNPIVRADFENFDLLTKRQQLEWCQPITNKTNQFFADKRIYQMFSQAKSSFNIRDVMDSGKILLISTDKGSLGDATSDLTNGLFLAKIQMAAFSRSDIPESKRIPWTLYLDEFQNFVSDSFSVTLSEGRKYKLSLVMAHQTLEQVPQDIRSIILGNTGIQVYFRINRADSEILAKEGFSYSGFDVKEVDLSGHRYWSLGESWERCFKELQHLQPRNAYVKHKIAGGMLPISTAQIKPSYEVLGMEEERYHEYLEGLPIGKKFLRERVELVREQVAREDDAGDGFTDDERTLLEFIYENSDVPVSQAYKAIGMNPRKGNQVKDEMKRQGLIEEIETRMGKNGKLAKFLIPTFEALERLGLEPPQGRGGVVHRYVAQMIVDGAKAKGFKADVEYPIPGGAVDVHLEKGDLKIGVEIAVVSKPDREMAHIRKNLDAGYDRVITVFADERLLERTQEAMKGVFSDGEVAKVRLVPLNKVSGLV